MIASYAEENSVKLWTVNPFKLNATYVHHAEPVTSVLFYESDKLITGSIDKKIYIMSILDHSVINNYNSVKIGGMDIDSFRKRLYVFSVSTKIVICYDLLNWGELFRLKENDNIFSMKLSQDGDFLLLNTSFTLPQIHLWDLNNKSIFKIYCWHRQQKFVIKAKFGGIEESLITAGSEDANIYMWHKNSTSIIKILEGHSSTVNTISFNPKDAQMLVSASDDHTLRIWLNENYKLELSSTIVASQINEGKADSNIEESDEEMYP